MLLRSMCSSLASTSLNKEKTEKAKAIERIKKLWSFDTYYESLLKKIELAASKEPNYWAKLPEADNIFRQHLIKRLRADGFTVGTPKSVENSEQYLLVSGWAIAFNENADTDIKKPSGSKWHYNHSLWLDTYEKHKEKSLWMLGEKVNDESVPTGMISLHETSDQNSLLYIGQSGSGKTEAMKATLTSFLITNPETEIYVCDPKKTSDWSVFAPFSKPEKILTETGEIFDAFLELSDLIRSRMNHMSQFGYRNREDWERAERCRVPEVILVIDEFTSLNSDLNFDNTFMKNGTPANALFDLYTRGRSMGIYILISSQHTSSDALPLNIMRNLRTRIAFKMGSDNDSNFWTGSVKSARIGKLNTNKSSEVHTTFFGLAFIEGVGVRFHKMEDEIILMNLIENRIKPTSREGLISYTNSLMSYLSDSVVATRSLEDKESIEEEIDQRLREKACIYLNKAILKM